VECCGLFVSSCVCVCPKSSLGLAIFVVEVVCLLFSPSIKEKGVLSRKFLKKIKDGMMAH
jgi:hypothetical protein